MKKMTAHTRIRAATPSAVADHCPAAALGIAIGGIQARMAALDGHPSNDLVARAELYQLGDRIDVLSAQLEWVRARSPEGLFAQLLQLRHRAVDLAFSEAPTDSRERRAFERLAALLIDGLPRLTAIDPAPLGSDHMTPENAQFWSTLDDRQS